MRKLAIALAVATALGLASQARAGLRVVDAAGNLVPNAGPWPLEPVHTAFESGPQGQMTMGSDEAPPAFLNNIPTGTRGYGGMFLQMTDPTAPVTFTMLGHGDATFNNEFVVPGCLDWTVAGTPVGTTVTCVVTPSVDNLVPFSFYANSNSGNIAANDLVHNGRPTLNAPYAQPDFGLFRMKQSLLLNQGTAFWIGFSDGGGAGNGQPDFDFQDMVIIVSVPEPIRPTASIPLSPWTLLLLAGALMALGGLRLRET